MAQLQADALRELKRQHRNGELYLEKYGPAQHPDGHPLQFTKAESVQVFNWNLAAAEQNQPAEFWRSNKHFDDLYEAKQGKLKPAELVRKGYTPDEVLGIYASGSDDEQQFLQLHYLLTQIRRGILPLPITETWFEKERNYTLADLRKAGLSADQFHPGLWKEAGFTPSELMRAGKTLPELRRAGRDAEPEKSRYTPAELKVAAREAKAKWTEKEVDALFTKEELKKQLYKDAKANQVGFEELKPVKEEFLSAAAALYGHRIEKRDFKKGLGAKTLDKLEQELAKRRKRYEAMKDRAWKQKFLDWQDELEQELSRIKEQKAKDRATYNEVKKRFLTLIDKRLTYLDGQLKKLRSDLKKPLHALDEERRAELKRIEEMNKAWAEIYYPVDQARGREPFEIRDATAGNGLVNEVIHHPYLDEEKGRQRRGAPLNNLVVLDKKRELLNWSIEALEGEQKALKEMKALVENSQALWKFVDRHEQWYPTLLNLGRSVTEVSRSSRLLKGKGPSEWKKEKTSTGARSFTLEFGASVGVCGGIASLGLNIAFSGTLSMDDDRRLRANLTLKLVPSFSVAIGGPAGKLIDLSASLGFTIVSQTYAFVDHKHFAYYVSFRLANLLNFTDKFTRYGNSALHQHISLYDPDIKTLMSHIIGKDEMATMETYLSKKPIVKVTPAPGAGYVPSVDLGFKEGIVGTESKASAEYKAKVYQKTELVLPELAANGSSSGNAPSSQGPSSSNGSSSDSPSSDGLAVGYYQIQYSPKELRPEDGLLTLGGAEYWRYKAKGDGHCFYYSFLFLNDVLTKGSFGDILGIVRNKIAEQAARLMDLYPQDTVWGRFSTDDPSEQAAVDQRREDLLNEIRNVRGSAYAGIEAIDAASIAYKVRITVFKDPSVDDSNVPDVVHYPLGSKDDLHVARQEAERCDEWPEVFILYTSMKEPGAEGRHLNHYEPLLPKADFAEGALPEPRQRLTPDVRFYKAKAIAQTKEELRPVAAEERTDDDMKQGLVLSLAPVPVPAQEDEGMVVNPHLLTRVRRGHSIGMSFELSGPSWMKTAVSAGYIHIVHDANPDNDGHYLNFKLTQGIFGRTPLSFPEDKDPPYYEIDVFKPKPGKPITTVMGNREDQVWQDIYKAKEDIAANTPDKLLDDAVVEEARKGLEKAAHEVKLDAIAKDIERVLKQAFEQAPVELKDFAGALDNFLTNNVEVKLNLSTRYIEFNLILDNQGVFRRQYTRWVYKTDSSVKAKGTVYQDPFVNVDLQGGVSWSKTVALQETLGTNTLSYVVTVFNGLKQREGGMDQWKAFCKKHPNNLRALFAQIAKKGTNARAEAEALDQLANDHPELWHTGDGKPPTSEFVKACEQAASDLKLKKQFSKNGQKKYGFRKPQQATVKAVGSLCEELTTVLIRSQKVAAVKNARMSPWRQYRVYLKKPAAKVRFNLKRRGAEYQVFKPLRLTFYGDGPYQHIADLLKNRTLANAYTALPFYQHNFEVEFKIVDPKGKEIIKLDVRQPNGLDVLHYELMKWVRAATKKRKGNLDVVEALVSLHYGLWDRFLPWFQAIRESKQDAEALVDSAVSIWEAWCANPNADPDYEEMLKEGKVPPVDAFEELLKEIRGPFVGYRMA